MKRTNLNAGQPVRNLQHFLRLISYYYNTVPAVIPDGIFSEQTREAVIGFQTTFSLQVTGTVNLETWNHIILVYNKLYEIEEEPLATHIFPNKDFTINPNDSTIHLYAIQAMIYSISNIFQNIESLEITGTYDEKCVNVVKNMQKLFDLETHGIIDKKTFNMISALYTCSVCDNPKACSAAKKATS